MLHYNLAPCWGRCCVSGWLHPKPCFGEGALVWGDHKVASSVCSACFPVECWPLPVPFSWWFFHFFIARVQCAPSAAPRCVSPRNPFCVPFLLWSHSLSQGAAVPVRLQLGNLVLGKIPSLGRIPVVLPDGRVSQYGICLNITII